ncbi:hypothetical protein AWB75_00969 [Caballeronia catudaia]|uniref:EAL domain-containing protein n=1 Tax=Caballeronia catudaia TaxID=1777136 RepID=A0A157ZMM9_9BURK|nr:hypothetical protein AWB75_00969 [Caballeronia catudaia]
MDVVSEGAATGSQLDRLQDMMCDEMQGFLLAMPLSADAFGVMLERGEVTVQGWGFWSLWFLLDPAKNQSEAPNMTTYKYLVILLYV